MDGPAQGRRPLTLFHPRVRQSWRVRVRRRDPHHVSIESTHTIDIDSFVPRTEINRRFFDTPYYITPNDPVGQGGLESTAFPARRPAR